MTLRMFAGVALLALFPSLGLAHAQTAAAPAAPAAPAAKSVFEAVDIHPSSPHRYPGSVGGAVYGDRYIFHQAMMVSLIAAAYNVQNDDVEGGPSWLETDRYEVIAKVAPKTGKLQIQQMLQSMLADRFKLVIKNDTKPMPAYILSVGKGSKLKESDGTGPSNCRPNMPQSEGPPQYIIVDCTNMTTDVIAKTLGQMAGGYLNQPVVDQTGLKNAYDFEIKWSPANQVQKQGPDGISIFKAVEDQLGLKLELKTAPRPVIAVISVNEKPTPNAPDIAKVLPPPPPARFDVATIKPSAPDAKPGGRGIQGTQIDIQDIPLKNIIDFVWDLAADDSTLVAPKWLDSTHIDILAKVAPESLGDNGPIMPQMDIEDLREMLKTLLIERYNIKSHTEDRPLDAYSLFAVNPKLRKADPTSRVRCKEGPGPDGKDPRIATPIINRLVSCQNMTMAQIGDELQRVANGYISSTVLDKTGIPGTWDFTLNFSSIQNMPGGGGANSAVTAPSANGGASDPSGALSLFDAVKQQLGLKLEKEKRPVPVLVIDHIDEKPTDN